MKTCPQTIANMYQNIRVTMGQGSEGGLCKRVSPFDRVVGIGGMQTLPAVVDAADAVVQLFLYSFCKTKMCLFIESNEWCLCVFLFISRGWAGWQYILDIAFYVWFFFCRRERCK